jgi:hypothetical protein
MNRNFDEMGELVLESVSNDYEQFDKIFDQIARWKSNSREEIHRDRIERSLFLAIEAKYVEAYLLHPHAPHATRVDATPEALHELWFFITPKGKEYLSKLEEHGEVP